MGKTVKATWWKKVSNNSKGNITWSLLTVIAAVVFFLLSCSQNNPRELNNPVFVFNNAFFKPGIEYRSFDEQARLLRELGYDGIEHREVRGILELKEALEREGLRIFTDYMRIDIENDPPYLPEWKEVIPQLAGSDIILWVHIHSREFEPSDQAADVVVVPILQELADFVKPYGLRVAIYHHINFLAQTVADSYRLAKKADRDNVGSVFNLAHFLMTEPEENLEEAIALTFPLLFAVSINGADSGETMSMPLERIIQPLGEGTYDVFRVVELLVDKGYDGPFGIQCFNLKGEPEGYLTTSINTWNEFRERYAQRGRIRR